MTLLAGIKVVDLTLLLPGPLATWHLQGLGAAILKVEPPGAGDYARTIGTMDGDASYFYRHLNRGKHIVQLDLKSAAGRGALFEHLRNADALIESFRPGVLARLGLALPMLQRDNPALSLISITGYGQRGPMAAFAGHDINYLALSGWLHELIADSDTPAVPNVQIGDVLGGGLQGALAAVAAILASRRTGRGVHVDVSMTASLLAGNIASLMEVQARGLPAAPRTTLLNGGVPCYGLYRTADDRYLAVGALELKFWSRLCEVIGRADFADIHWQRGHLSGPVVHAVRAELAQLFAARPLEHWQRVFSSQDCCVTPVLRMDEALVHPAAQGYVASARGDLQPTLRTVGPPLRTVD